MAVAYDNSNSGGAAAASITISLTVAGDFLIAPVLYYNPATFVQSVTFDGINLTAVPSSQISNGDYFIELWSLIAPHVTTANLVATFGGSSPFDAGLIGISASGVHQTTPLGTPVLTSGTSTTPSATVSSAAGELVIDGLIIVHGGTLTVGSGQTQRANATANGFVKRGASTEPGGPSVVLDWSNSSSQAWAQVAVAIKAAGGGGGVKAGPIVSGGILKSLVGGALAA